MNTENRIQKLEEEKKLLIDELGDLGHKDTSTGEWEATPEAQTAPEADENDLSDRSEDFEERSSTLSPLRTRLEDIDLALQNIKEGTYGICETCAQKIEEDRLDANPAARTCKACMEKVI